MMAVSMMLRALAAGPGGGGVSVEGLGKGGRGEGAYVLRMRLMRVEMLGWAIFVVVVWCVCASS